MNVYGWKKIKKEITLKSILGETYVDFSSKSIDLDFDIETIYKNPKKFSDMKLSIRHIDSSIARKDFHGELFVESGENLIALCFLYMSLNHHGTDFKVVEDVLMDNEGYVYAEELPEDKKAVYKKFVARLESKVENLIDSGLVDDIRALCNKYAEMKFTAEVYEVAYIGPTKAIKYSGDMSIGEFSEMIKDEFNVIPAFIRKGTFCDCPATMKLRDVGISGEKVLDVKIKSYVYSLGVDIKKQNNLENVFVDFKYANRPWALIEEGTFDEVNVLPGFFKSLYWTLTTRFIYKYLA